MHPYMKNMVCNRCILVVQQELQKLNIDSCKFILGEVETTGELPKVKLQQLKKEASAYQFLSDLKLHVAISDFFPLTFLYAHQTSSR